MALYMGQVFRYGVLNAIDVEILDGDEDNFRVLAVGTKSGQPLAWHARESFLPDFVYQDPLLSEQAAIVTQKLDG